MRRPDNRSDALMSGVTEFDRRLRAQADEAFGPVRAVEPEPVFELGSEGIQASSRHQPRVARRFPRNLRRRTDKAPAEADSRATRSGMINGPT
jgi:DNA ligase-1